MAMNLSAAPQPVPTAYTADRHACCSLARKAVPANTAVIDHCREWW